MINAGAYNKKIEIYEVAKGKDKDGFEISNEILVLSCYAKVKTTKGYTLISSGSDFEKAYTNFTIRYPRKEIDRKMYIKYNNRIYSIEYLNNVDEANIELEIQGKLVEQ